MDAWERRWQGLPPEQRPPRPRLLHSNLGGWVPPSLSPLRVCCCNWGALLVAPFRRPLLPLSECSCQTPAAALMSCCCASAESYDEIIATWRLPPRIRPALFAFGTLADGFLPFDLDLDPPAAEQRCEASVPPGAEQLLQHPGSGAALPCSGAAGAADGAAAAESAAGGAGGGSGSGSGGGGGSGSAEMHLCSVVMKAVQSRHPGGTLPPSTESGGAGRENAVG